MDVSTLSSMLASPLPPSFLGTYSLSTSSLGCNALCIVISFLVLWSICLSSSLVHLRKGPEYLTRDYYYYYYTLWFFHITVSRWSFPGVWVTASLLRFPGLLLVFWPIAIILWSGRSRFVLLFLFLTFVGFSVWPEVACDVSDCCNLSFLPLFNVFFESWYWCISAILNILKSSSFFFTWLIYYEDH